MKFNSLIPEIGVFKFKESLDFYTNVLGFKIEYERPSFAFLSLEKNQLMIEKINNEWNVGKLAYPLGRGLNLQMQVKNIDPLIKSLKGSKYPLFKEKKDNWYLVKNKLMGNQEFLVQDPNGYLLRFFKDLGEKK